jgi:glycine betaine/choline ABC-type transport system substrate-binding protein
MGGEKIVAGLIAAAGVHWLTACARDKPITVGSKNFTEQVILGEIVAQHVSLRLSQRVDRKLNLGGTLLAHQAMLQGGLDLYPEYTGTALTSILKLPLSAIPVGGGPAKGAPPTPTPAEVFAKVRAEYQSRFGILWLDPLGFNNTFAMVIRGPDARRNKIDSLSDAARYAAGKEGWTLGVGYEFQQRPDGLPGLLKTYRLPIKGSPKTMDLGLLYKALEQKQVDMVAANATDGLLSVMDVKVLRDDKRYFPPYQAALTVRAGALAVHPGLKEALDQLSGKFSDEIMRALNHQVDGKHRPVSEVAVTFLRAAGFMA